MESKRNKKSTKSQMKLLVNFLEKNRVMTTGKTHPLNISEIENKWDELTKLLNNIENGARKDKKQWKTFLYEWKSKTKKKARSKMDSIRQTGGGEFICEELNDIENRLLKVYGWVHVVGCPGAPVEVDPENINDVPIVIGEGDIEMGTNENIEIEVIEAITQNPSTSNSTGTVPQKKKKKNVSELQQSAEAYCTSSNEMASAMREMANAMKEMAAAFSQLSHSIDMFTKFNKVE